jgi:hypothetical protein
MKARSAPALVMANHSLVRKWGWPSTMSCTGAAPGLCGVLTKLDSALAAAARCPAGTARCMHNHTHPPSFAHVLLSRLALGADTGAGRELLVAPPTCFLLLWRQRPDGGHGDRAWRSVAEELGVGKQEQAAVAVVVLLGQVAQHV